MVQDRTKASFYKKLFVLLLFGYTHFVSAQWTDNFETGTFNDWSGDVSLFTINEDGQLQLDAPTAGEATIWRNSTISSDTVSIGFYHKMDFAPSDNNRSIIYLSMDNKIIDEATGYYAVIGENGSDDAIRFYFTEKGNEELIASATMGAMAKEPATVKINIDIYPGGLWSIKTNYENGDFTSLDVEFVDDRYDVRQGSFFGISCKFSGSRADKFFYDNMYVKKHEKDTAAPEVVSVVVLTENSIRVVFNEPVNETALETSRYTIAGLGQANTILKSNTLGTHYDVMFSSLFDSKSSYTLTINNISDVEGNVLNEHSFSFIFPKIPTLNELLISEILFDPYIDGEDFVEFYNPSENYLLLEGLAIRNDQRKETKSISENITLAPLSYIAFSKDINQLVQQYKPQDGNIYSAEIPAFNNDEGNLMIINSEGIILDSFDYDEDMHFQLIDDTEGVSLERANFNIASTARNNWKSASKKVRFATPGYANSALINFTNGEEIFEILTETFSPNQDGQEDEMILQYKLNKSGYVANIAVHDAAGFKIKTLSSNELLGAQGAIFWNGLNEQGTVADLGIYIIIGEVFHPDGEVISIKKTTVLSDFID